MFHAGEKASCGLCDRPERQRPGRCPPSRPAARARATPPPRPGICRMRSSSVCQNAAFSCERLACHGEIDRRDLDAARVESRIGGAGMAQDANERRAEHDEQDRARDLADHERAPQPRTPGRRPHAVLERRARIDPRTPEGRQDTEDCGPRRSRATRAKSNTRQSSVRGRSMRVGSAGRRCAASLYQHARQTNAEQAAAEKQHGRLVNS